MKEYKCKACKKLLFKGNFKGKIELRCTNQNCKLKLVTFTDS